MSLLGGAPDMTPEVVIHYKSPKTGDHIAKAAFSNVSDALIFWEALPEQRRQHMVATDLDGTPIVSFTYVGVKVDPQTGEAYYSHAAALTQALADKFYPDRSSHEGRGRTFIDTGGSQ